MLWDYPGSTTDSYYSSVLLDGFYEAPNVLFCFRAWSNCSQQNLHIDIEVHMYTYIHTCIHICMHTRFTFHFFLLHFILLFAFPHVLTGCSRFLLNDSAGSGHVWPSSAETSSELRLTGQRSMSSTQSLR